MATSTKTFLIGLPKSGTTSLYEILRSWGYRCMGERPDLMADRERGEMSRIFAAIDEADCFRTIPWQYLYPQCLERYGEQARFVLTTRATPEVWVDSMRQHSLRYEETGMRVAQFGHEFPHGREDAFKEIYAAHNEAVRAYFRAQGAQHLLLDVCWEAGHGWPEVCQFFGQPIPEEPFPRANSRESFSYDPAIVEKNKRRIAEQTGG